MNRPFTLVVVASGILVSLFAAVRSAFADGAPAACHGEVRVVVAHGADPTLPGTPQAFGDFTCHGECILGVQVCHPFNDPLRNMGYCACWYDANGDGVPQQSEVVAVRCCDVNAGTSGGQYTGAYGCVSTSDCCLSPATCKLKEIGRVADSPSAGLDTVTLTCICQ